MPFQPLALSPQTRRIKEQVKVVASNEHVFAVSLTIYRVATVGALALVYWLTHRLCLGWALTTLDAVLVLHFAATLVFLEGWSTSDAITAPGALMVLLVLAQATVRYRPALVAYPARAGGLCSRTFSRRLAAAPRRYRFLGDPRLPALARR